MKVLHLISGGDRGGAKTHVLLLLASLMKEINVRVCCFMEGAFWREIRETDIPSMLISQRYRNDLSVVGKLIKHIHEEGYDIIHAHGARANFVAVMVKPFINAPVVTTVHSDYRMDFTESIYKRIVFTNLNALSLRLLDYYVAVSDSFRQMLIKRKFDPDRVLTVYNAMDFDALPPYAPRDEFFARHNIQPGNNIIVGIIGRFDKVKGHEVFIRAAAKVLSVRGGVLFVLAGDGADQPALESLARQLGIRRSLYFLGFVKDIFSFINAIDINVCTSYSESFPYMLLEGAAMRKPTVSTAVGGIPDLIKHGETGLLAPSGDYNAIGEHILTFIEDAELRAKLGENLHQYSRENFSTDSMKKRQLEIYDHILAQERALGRRFDIILSGYYGFNNSGDDAILDAIIHALRTKRAGVALLALSKTPRQSAARYNIFSVNRFNFFHILKYMRRTRLFVYGGGSIIQDVTSTNSLIYYTVLIHLAKYFGVRVMLYANGVGPVTRPKNRLRAQNALRRCDYITIRDPESFAELRRLGVTSGCRLSSDPALSVEPSPPEAVEKILAAENILPGKYFALSFRQWKRSDPQFAGKMARVIDRLAEQYNLTPLFVPMQFPSDAGFSREIALRVKARSVILSRNYTVSELMGILSRTEFVIGMRLHTLIFAASQGVPVIGVIYDPKVRAFMSYIGQETFVDCENIDCERLLAITDSVIQNAGAVRAAIREEAAKLKRLSNKDAEIVMDMLDDVNSYKICN
ncbi:MAG: polysaccharide pyruvyl transferase CsaB [Clostridiales bacterium]|jgi:polysaccharide pyruvyl transferase CsaB|nr:polysaccharide pyruvyl transferase CsaB [Clostridiales bacterium]